MADLENVDRRVTALEEWRNSQAINSALIKQHQKHMDERIASHAEHMDRRFDEHATLMQTQVTDMSDNFKKINGWMSKLALAVIIAVAVALAERFISGGIL